MNQNLIEKLRSYIELYETEERFISSVFKLKHLAKGEHFLLAGGVCREAAFIESGVFRFYINTGERGFLNLCSVCLSITSRLMSVSNPSL